MAGRSSTQAYRYSQIVRLLAFAVVLLLIGLGRRYGWIEPEDPAAKPDPVADATATAASPGPPPTAAPSATASPLLVRNVTLRNQDGTVIYRGDIDLQPTLERIAAGRRNHFSHDGTTFQNRERRLPQKPPNYYTEWVVPTPREDGPGPQRIVTGADGDVWYTPDHYRTFQRMAYKLPTGSAEDR